jgi:hypothetical protein
MSRQTIAAFLYTTFLGPLFGYFGAMAYMFWKVARAPGASDYFELLFLSYYIGGIPAIITGAIVAWLVSRRGWISSAIWFIATALIAAVPFALMAAIVVIAGDSNRIERMTLEIIAPIWLAAVVFASVGLRATMIASGTLVPPGRSDGVAHPIN